MYTLFFAERKILKKETSLDNSVEPKSHTSFLLTFCIGFLQKLLRMVYVIYDDKKFRCAHFSKFMINLWKL